MGESLTWIMFVRVTVYTIIDRIAKINHKWPKIMSLASMSGCASYRST